MSEGGAGMFNKIKGYLRGNSSQEDAPKPKREVLSKEEQYIKLFKQCCDDRLFFYFKEACADNVEFIDVDTMIAKDLVAPSKEVAVDILEKITGNIVKEEGAPICTRIGKIEKYHGPSVDRHNLVGKPIIMLGTTKNMFFTDIIFFGMNEFNRVAKIFSGRIEDYSVSVKEARHYAPDEYVYLNLIKDAIDLGDCSRLFNYLAYNVKFTNLEGNSSGGCYAVAYNILGRLHNIYVMEEMLGMDYVPEDPFNPQLFLVEVKGYKRKVDINVPIGKKGLALSLTGFDKYRAVMFIEIGADNKISSINVTKNNYILEELMPIEEICRRLYKDNTDIIANNVKIAAHINGIKPAPVREIVRQHMLRHKTDPVYALMSYVNNFYCYKEKVAPDIEHLMATPLQQLNSDNSLVYVSIVYYAYIHAHAARKGYDDRVLKVISESWEEFEAIILSDVLNLTVEQANVIKFVTAELTRDDIESDLAKVLTKYVVCAWAPDLDFAYMYKLVYMYLSKWIKEQMEEAYREVDNIQKFYTESSEKNNAPALGKGNIGNSPKKQDNIGAKNPRRQQKLTLGDLRELKKMLDEGVITQEDFDAAKRKILG